jgi:hypothetical protein
MEYNLIELTEHLNHFSVTITPLKGDREERDPIPSGAPGKVWIYYPKVLSTVYGVDILKKYIKETAEERIRTEQAVLKKLQNIKF